MKCTHIKRLLPLYAGGDLPIQEADSVRAHLFACQHCNDLAIDFSESSSWLDSQGRVDFDDRFFDELRDSVWQRVRAEQRESPQSSWRYAWILLFASATAIAVLAAMPLLRSRDSRAPAKIEVARETRAPDVVSTVTDASPVKQPTRRHINRLSVRRDADAVAVMNGERPASTESFKLEEPAPSPNVIRRIEIQTADPTIRIIWIVQEPAAPLPTQVETEE